MIRVAALFVRSDSCYADLVSECWDVARDARGYRGPLPVVAHPPCRAWGRLKHLAKPRPDEKELGLWAVGCVRRWGGVLEHPHGSGLWRAAGLPAAGLTDAWGGFTLLVDQGWWGHAAPKPTLLYFCGVSRSVVQLPPIPVDRARGRTGNLCREDRERTPVEFALWLARAAESAGRPQLHGPGVRPVVSAASKRAGFRAWAASGI
jgi:hypothetical protein